MEYSTKISSFQRSRNNAVKALKKGQKVWLNTWSTDCDGCSAQDCRIIKSVQDVIDAEKAYDKAIEWADGPMGYEFVFNEIDKLEPYCGGYWGM